MAEYIENVIGQTSKLDWAFPFQRTGAFPLDRSVLFSSLADAKAYAQGDGSDERALGGTSYVGQIISVLDEGEVAAYVITKARGLMKLAATTATGDLASDVADLQGKVDSVISKAEANAAAIEAMKPDIEANKSAVTELNTKIADVYTKSETDAKIGEAIAAAPHMVRKVVENLAAVEAEKDTDAALNTIYMVPSGLQEEDNKYYEYIVIEVTTSEGDDGETARQVERVGSWEVDLSAYAKTEDVIKKLADKANQSTVDTLAAAVEKKANAATTIAGYGITDAYTQSETDAKIAEAVKSATGGESAASVLAELNAYKTSNNAAVNQNKTDIAALQEVGAEKNVINSASEEFTIDENRQLNVASISIAKVTNLQDELDKLATKEAVQIEVAKITNLQGRMDTAEKNIAELQTLLTWNEIAAE